MSYKRVKEDVSSKNSDSEKNQINKSDHSHQ